MKALPMLRPVVRVVVVSVLVVTPLLPASTAVACPLTDPSCGETIVAQPGDAAADAVTQVEGDTTAIVEDATGVPAGEIVEEVNEVVASSDGDQVDRTVAQAREIVLGEEVEPTAAGSTDPTPDGDRTGAGGSVKTRGHDSTRARASDDPRRHGGGDWIAAQEPAPVRPLRPEPGADLVVPEVAGSTSLRVEPDRRTSGAIARVIAEAGKIGFPLLLALMVGAFVLVQRRIDAREVTLTLCSTSPDDMRFS
jgi:hypothetical protein